MNEIVYGTPSAVPLDAVEARADVRADDAALAEHVGTVRSVTRDTDHGLLRDHRDDVTVAVVPVVVVVAPDRRRRARRASRPRRRCRAVGVVATEQPATASPSPPSSARAPRRDTGRVRTSGSGLSSDALMSTKLAVSTFTSLREPREPGKKPRYPVWIVRNGHESDGGVMPNSMTVTSWWSS